MVKITEESYKKLGFQYLKEAKTMLVLARKMRDLSGDEDLFYHQYGPTITDIENDLDILIRDEDK